MIEFYPQIKAVHIAMVLASGLLFALRGAGVLAGMHWPMRLPVKLLSYTIDTTLLTAALMLFTILPHAMFSNGWLTAKLVLLVVYIGLGTFALKRGRTRRTRAITYVTALCVFGFIISIARAHHPLGLFFMLRG
ncbi:SirB2 family protein [Cognatilysobacter segetis]|uniref:SirB2 family protein n=1 Tax=Cognatilysobacter segetis TaxID=2492394 RepID=UPI00105D45A1|nr:SirB2 family protein [Lysobacter segetis]